MEEKIKEKAFKKIANEFNESSKGTGENLGSCALEISKTTKGLVEICLSPFNMVIWSYNNIKEKFIPLVAKKLRKTPDDNIQTPKTSIAGPTIEALRFASEEPELQNMFANLLATSMDKETASNAHPSFVEIIKQLSPDEARILDYMNKLSSAIPIIDIRIQMGEAKHFLNYITNFSLIGEISNCSLPYNSQSYIDNLCRLKLCDIPNGHKIANKDVYSNLEKNDLIQNHIKELKKNNEKDPIFIHKKLDLTNFGRAFINSCIKNRDEEELQKDPETSSG
jgi:hypothetical protein